MSVPNPKKVLFATDLTETSTTDIEGAGTIREDAQGNTYRWVKNTHSAAFAVASLVVYDGATKSQVTIPATASLYNGAGAVLAASFASGSYGWIQCKGVGTVAVLVSNTAYSVALNAIGLVNGAVYGQAVANASASAATGLQPLLPMASLDTASASATSTLSCAFNFRL